MKKILLFLITLSIFSCSNDNSFIESTVNSGKVDIDGISTVTIINGEISTSFSRSKSDGHIALQFRDYACLRRFMSKLEALTEEEKEDVMSKYGIKTLHDIVKNADDELERIATESKSEEEFKLLYQTFKNKYQGKLIANSLDDTDLDLYVPDGDNVMTYIANEQLEYVVGNNVVTLPQNNVLPISAKLNAGLLSSTGTDYNVDEYSPKSGKRVYFRAYMVGARMWVHMSARKKMWYGWKNDPHRSFYFTPCLSNNVQYLAEDYNGNEISYNPPPLYVLNRNVKNGFDIILCKIIGGSTIRGYVKTWTDMTSEHDSNGNELTETINGWFCPKCLDSTARIININLSPTN